VAGFVTQAFPFPWMGGTQAIKGMEKLVQAKGGKVSATGVVNGCLPVRGRHSSRKLIEKIVAV